MSTAVRPKQLWTENTYPRNKRAEPRVKLPAQLVLRWGKEERSITAKVMTENISRNGARIICPYPIDLQAQVDLFAFKGRFKGMAVVRYQCALDRIGFALGIELIMKNGVWIIA